MDQYNLLTVVGFLAIIYLISLCIMLSIPSLKKTKEIL